MKTTHHKRPTRLRDLKVSQIATLRRLASHGGSMSASRLVGRCGARLAERLTVDIPPKVHPDSLLGLGLLTIGYTGSEPVYVLTRLGKQVLRSA